MQNLQTLLKQLSKEGCNPETLKQVEQLAAATTAEAGIIRTNKGALMVRVGASRWPIAMYKNDWKILLSKVPLIEEALEKMDIPDENPDKEGSRAFRASRAPRSVQVARGQRVRSEDEDREEEAA